MSAIVGYRTRKYVGYTITGVMVVCAVTMTVLTLRSELRPGPAASPTVYRPVAAPNGRSLVTAGHRSGPLAAPVTFVEFADFQCPYCNALQTTLKELRDRYPTQVSVLYRHYPLPAHPFAKAAAIASECAGVQGRFDEYARLLFLKQDSIGRVSWATFAGRAGVPDVGEFDRCRESPLAKARVEADVAAGARMGIGATPALFLQDEMMVGATPMDQLETWMRAQGYRLSSGVR